MKAIEKNIEFDGEGKSHLNLGKDFSGRKAKVILLFEEEEITEKALLNLAMKGSAFDFLKDPVEDIYTMEDGVPYERKAK